MEGKNSQTRAGGGTSRGNVTATGYYNRKSKNGYYYYQPYKLEVVATVSVPFEVEYSIGGAGYRYRIETNPNTNTENIIFTFVEDTSFGISIKKTNPVRNQVYSTNNTAPYYFRTYQWPFQWNKITFIIIGNENYTPYSLPGSV